MLTQDLTFSKSLNPFSLSSLKWKYSHFRKPFNPVSIPKSPVSCFFLKPHQNPNPPSITHQHSATHHRRLPHPPSAGRSKKKPTTGRIEGSAELRGEAKRNARRKSRRLAESLFYRLKNPHKSYADNFSEEELQMIGLGYDRMVRFMSKDDPRLKHPYDWYKYGEYGPYSWRGIVVGDPIRGRMSDECATIIGDNKTLEDWEKIDQYEMNVSFGNRLRTFDTNVGLQNYWVFVRHPRWRLGDLPCEQWTLVCEVVLEAGDQKLDKWNLMGRLGNKTRAMITKCAAWIRPDIVYVKRPVFQCRFEPQVNFFRAMLPLLDPKSENDYLFELEDDEGRIELVTYFGGLCKIVRSSQKAYVDDVVKAYEKLSDEKKSKCLEFLLSNHPVQLLHPWTKEWKDKLEEMEMGCDAPDDEDEGGSLHRSNANLEFSEWIEEDDNDDNNEADEDDEYEDEEDDYDADDNVVVNTTEELGLQDDDDEEEDEDYWKDEFQKAIKDNNEMESFVKKSVQRTNKVYESQLKAMEQSEGARNEDGGDGDGKSNDYGDETAMRGKRAKVSPQEWRTIGRGPWRKKVKKSKIPPELFLRAAVRPFTYRNLVKEIVLTRHSILDGEIELEE